MLASLAIRDIVLIERLDLNFDAGLTVLTGETGAGKSILIDALTLALGGRGDAGLVRHGATQGQVTAAFDLEAGHPVRALLAENDIENDGDVIIRRVQTADGRTRAFLNDQPVSAGLLRQVGAALVEVHGQHDDRALVDPESHRALLDAFGGLEAEVQAVSGAYSGWKRAEKALTDQRKRIDEARREADYLRSSAEELARLKPQPGEETRLAAARARMMQAEKIAGDLTEAQEALGGSGSPIPELASLLRRLERKADKIAPFIGNGLDALSRALDALEEASLAFSDGLRRSEYDPAQLEQTEERLFALRAAARKYSVAVDDLADLRSRMEQALADLDAGEDLLAGLEKTARDAGQLFDRAAATLSAARAGAAGALEAAVLAELPALKLERARFIAHITSEAASRSPSGIDQVEFRVQTNPGTRPGPMMKVASGGELSRFLLALKVCLADKGSAPTLVFDEIDTGVGGAVAEAIGVRLSRLADKVQVLSVTHAPQVAARAASHMRISKSVVEGADRVATRVEPLKARERREEIARMLAGEVVTDEARKAADRLIKGA